MSGRRLATLSPRYAHRRGDMNRSHALARPASGVHIAAGLLAPQARKRDLNAYGLCTLIGDCVVRVQGRDSENYNGSTLSALLPAFNITGNLANLARRP